MSLLPAKTASHRSWLRINPATLIGVPYVVFLLVFGIVPMILAFIFSISKYGAYQPVYFAAGLSNYIKTYTDPQFVTSFTNILKFAAMALPTSFIFGVGIALLLNLSEDRLGSSMRTIFFLPGAITLSAVALIWVFMIDPGISPFGFILRAFGAKVPKDLINSTSIIVLLVVLRFWAFSGGWIAIFYGALTGINREMIEAAMLDGCGPWQMAWFVKRPAIMGYVWFMLINLTIQSLQLFAEPYVISTAAAGMIPIDPYWSPNMWAQFITVRTGDFGSSATISLFMLALSMVAAIFIVKRTGFFKTEVVKD